MNPIENSSPASPAAPLGIKPHRLIKLGVDVHLREYVVARQVDGLAPQSAQCFSPEAFIAWAAKQAQQADVVHCCYEAGPFDPKDRNIQKWGGAYPVNSLPEGLQAVQSGKPGHFVIGPKTPMTLENYQKLLIQAKLGNSNVLP